MIAALLSSFFVLFCGLAAAQPEETVLIGEYGSLTGAEATFGQSTHNGIMLAIEEANAAGGVNGKRIVVKTYDDQGKTQEAGTAVTRLITDDKVVAILGEVNSSLSIAGGRVAQQYGVPMVTPSSTNAAVTQVGDMIFRVCFVDAFQGFVAAKFATQNLGLSRFATLYDQGSAYSKGLKDDFGRAFDELGGTVLTEQAYNSGDQDFSAQLGSIRDAGVQGIYLPGYYTDVGNIAIQARSLGLTAVLLGGDGWDSAKLAEIGGDAIEGGFYSNHYAVEEERPEVKAFVTAFEARYGHIPDGLSALSYDAGRVLVDAMRRAPTLSGADIAAALASIENFPGVTGNITIDKDRNAVKPAVMVEMKGGRPSFVASILPRDKNAPEAEAVVLTPPTPAEYQAPRDGRLTKLLQTSMDGVAVGSLYALIALGYTMVYGILRFINFAHGDVFMLGAWLSFITSGLLRLKGAEDGYPFWAAPIVIFVVMVVAGALGFLIEWLAYRPMRDAPRINVLITAIGVSLFLENAGQLPFLLGTQPQRMPTLLSTTPLLTVAGVHVRAVDVLVVLIALALMAALEWLIYGTKLGLAMRAVSHDTRTAALMGVPVDRVISLTFVVGSALAAAAGFLYAQKYPGINQPAHPTWILLGLKAFVAAVIGGIGNMRGAMIGGLLIGFVELFGAAYLSPHLRDVYVFTLLIAVLLFKPEGLLGKTTVEKV